MATTVPAKAAAKPASGWRGRRGQAAGRKRSAAEAELSDLSDDEEAAAAACSSEEASPMQAELSPRPSTRRRAASGVAALVALSVPRGGSDDDDQPGSSGGSGGGGGRTAGSSSGGSGSDVLPARWDPEAVAAYYRRRPVLVARRVAEVAAEAAGWGAALLGDRAAGTVQRNAAARADAAMAAIERLGPAYVKVAQALSTRVDLLPPEYLLAIQRLQVGGW